MNRPLSLLTRSHGRSRRRAAVAALVAVATVGAAAATTSADDGPDTVVGATRGSGDLSLIDAATLDVETLALPSGSEPMYVNHDPAEGLVWVGDRGNSRVIALDDETFEMVTSVDVAAGVFHQWVDSDLGQLWVVADVANAVSVVDTATRSVVATIPLPADIVADGGRPHDVFVAGELAFVSIVGLASDGVVLQYSTDTLAEIGRVTTGGDPHLFVSDDDLYVASQDSSSVTRYRADDLRLHHSVDVPAAHGIWITDRQEVLVTNIAGGGVDAVWEFNRSLRRISGTTDTAVPVPHNVTVDGDRQAFVTHSGATADQVMVIDLDGDATASVTVGTNPFGLAVVD